jgi:aspartate carbamoyltransferase catalytic subunit
VTLEVLTASPSLSRPNPSLVGQLQPARRQRRHVLDLDDFSVPEIEAVLQTSAAMKDVLQRPIKKVPTLRGKTLITLFYEASTRTRVGFEVAAKALGADTVSVAASTSSVTKGESLIDTIRTLQALGADFVVMRHHQAGAPYVVAEEVGPTTSVINAGDGWHAHPTQALLDLFTIRERLGRIAGVRVAIIGDVLHSRVARSNLWGLTLMGASVVLCGPPPAETEADRTTPRWRPSASGPTGSSARPDCATRRR